MLMISDVKKIAAKVAPKDRPLVIFTHSKDLDVKLLLQSIIILRATIARGCPEVEYPVKFCDMTLTVLGTVEDDIPPADPKKFEHIQKEIATLSEQQLRASAQIAAIYCFTDGADLVIRLGILWQLAKAEGEPILTEKTRELISCISGACHTYANIPPVPGV